MTEKRHSDVSVPVNLQDQIVVNGKAYIKLKQIGSGGSCKVYRVLDESNEILALKCVDLSNVSSYQYNDYVNEVKLLETLRGSPGIIHMIDYDLQKENRMLYIVGSFSSVHFS
jgi:singapore isolate B (sub-type 7) whole genome shotgun sequence assembly, scaffold_9